MTSDVPRILGSRCVGNTKSITIHLEFEKESDEESGCSYISVSDGECDGCLGTIHTHELK
jgi:hypothetical protein